MSFFISRLIAKEFFKTMKSLNNLLNITSVKIDKSCFFDKIIKDYASNLIY